MKNMQFIPNGPDIPNELLQAHEDGKVVFFCGAGIGYPAGLKNFKGLVNDIYSRLNTNQEGLEVRLYEDEKYDLTLDRLECRHPGGRISVRKALADSLQPDLSLKGATETHLALLELARTHNKEQSQQSLRLVTTNFDRIFHDLICKSKTSETEYLAPLLPIPKNSRWNGLVYLHGLLPEKHDEMRLNQLVVTSGDFGLAYLTERWASRFVSELFRNYTVCFIGYSLNDPVMRYMMDAFAADRRLGEQTIEAYAFTDYNAGQKNQSLEDWKAKGVTPILYEVPAKTHDHSALHKTLKTWANTYRDGIQGKEHIVRTLASIKPAASTLQDDFVGRMLWALSDPSGLPAKRFAQITPAPPIEWLESFSELRFGPSDLPQFGVFLKPDSSKNLQFSFMRRPSPANLAPHMSVKNNDHEGKWDAVMKHLGQWLVQHLNDA